MTPPLVRFLAAWILATLAPGPVAAQSEMYDLLVTSRTDNTVKRYDGATGEFLGNFIAPQVGGISAPQEVLIGPNAELIVSARFTSTVGRFDRRTGAYLGPFTSGYALDEGTKMAYGPDGNLYVSQWGQSQSTVARFDGTTGAFIDEATPTLNQPMSQAWDGSGMMYVVNFGSHDVQRFDADGNFVDVFIASGRIQGGVNLWFLDGELYVVDWQVGRVLRFDGATGEYLGIYVSGLQNAEGWAFGPDGNFYLADWAANRINRYDPTTGNLIDVFASGGGLQQPNSLLFVERLPDFTLAASPGTAAIGPGSNATLTVTVSPDRGLAFEESVTLSCSGLPAGATCTFDPASVVPGANGATTTLTVRPAQAAAVPAAVFALAVLALIGGTWHASARRYRPIAVTAALLFASALSACGDSTGPETNNVTLTVTGTAGDLVRTTTVTLTVSGG